MATRTSADVRADWLDDPTQAAETVSDGERTVRFSGQLYDGRSIESVLDAYRRKGSDAFSELDGAYACLVWDAPRRTVVAARDALGLHPLFYARAGDTLLFSPSLEALVAADGVDSALNRAALADHICGRWPDPGETYYEGIRRVPPGHVLQATTTGVDVRRYWFPVHPDEPPKWVESSELERFDDLMNRAAGHALELGRAGLFLSGGLDSVSVAAVTTDLSRRTGMPDPIALSLVFPEDADEERVQRGVAEQLGLPQIMLPFEEAVGGPVLDRALEVVATWPSPFTNAWHSAYRTLTLAGKDEGVQVIVTGGGGDEWLTVTPMLAADLLRRGDVAGLYHLWRTMLRSFPVRPGRTAKNLLWTFGAKPILADAGARLTPRLLARYRRNTKLRLTPTWVAPESHLRAQLLQRAYDSSLPTATHGFYLREGQLSLDHALVSMEMEDFFETSRRTGVPIRMPFWDRDLVDFLYRTPPAALNEDGRSKGLVRKLLQRRFPELGFERHKKVIATGYFSQLVKREGPRVWAELGGAPALASRGIVEQAQLESFTKAAFAAGTPRDLARVWIVMSLERWVRSHDFDGGR